MLSGSLLSYLKKRKISRNGHLLSLVVIRCHSLSFVVPLVVTCCHLLSLFCHSLSPVVPLVVIRCHSLSLVVLLVVNRCHSLSLDVLLVCLFISDPYFQTSRQQDNNNLFLTVLLWVKKSNELNQLRAFMNIVKK